MIPSTARVVAGRHSLSLDGRWRFLRDPGDEGREAGWPARGLPEPSDRLDVPGVWNRAYPRYEGIAWYETSFMVGDAPNGPAWLRVGAANQYAEFWLNGTFLGGHEGGYVPFALRCDQALRGDRPNRLVARVIDPPAEGEAGGLKIWETACAKETWYYRYGGIWGRVAVEWRGLAWLQDVFLRASPDLRVALASVEIGSSQAGPGQVRLELRDPGGRPLGAAEQAIDLREGQTMLDLSLPVGEPMPWEPERPAQHLARVTLDAAGQRETAEIEFGLRTSELRDGLFFLNGRERYLKGALVQPNYPLELVRPHEPALLDREIEALRMGGFNLARVHLRPPAPGFLERADRAGLLVYVETALAWIRPHDRLRERGEREVRETLRLLRNHPSVAIWGCFNENRPAAKLVGQGLMALAHWLDSTRPVVDDSGGTAVDEGGGWRGQSWAWSDLEPEPRPFNDLHLYFGSPLRAKAERFLLDVGSEATFPMSVEGEREVDGQLTHALAPGAVFVSEFGYGGIPDLDRVAAELGDEVEPIDAQDVLSYRDRLREGFAQRALHTTFGGLPELVTEAQRLHARGDARQAEDLRLNPRVSGYVLTQLNDAAWELSAGLVDIWRRPKPALFAMARVNAPRLLVLRSEYGSAVAGSTIPLHAWLVDEHPEAGSAALRLSLTDESDRIVWEHERQVPIGSRREDFGASALRVPRLTGTYRVRGALRLGDVEVRVNEPLLVLPNSPSLDGSGLQVAGARLLRCFPAADGWLSASRPLLAEAAALSDEDLADVAGWLRRGGRAALLDVDNLQAPRVGTALGLDLNAQGTRGSFLGYVHFLRDHPLFAGLPTGVAHEPFAEVLPAWSLREIPGSDVHAGVVTVGSDASWAWFADVQTVSVGQGQVTFYHYQPQRAWPDDPIAAHLLSGLRRWLLSG